MTGISLCFESNQLVLSEVQVFGVEVKLSWQLQSLLFTRQVVICYAFAGLVDKHYLVGSGENQMAMATNVLGPQNITDKAIVSAPVKTTKTVNKVVRLRGLNLFGGSRLAMMLRPWGFHSALQSTKLVQSLGNVEANGWFSHKVLVINIHFIFFKVLFFRQIYFILNPLFIIFIF